MEDNFCHRCMFLGSLLLHATMCPVCSSKIVGGFQKNSFGGARTEQQILSNCTGLPLHSITEFWFVFFFITDEAG